MNQRINVTRSSLPPLEEYIEQIKPLWDSRWITNNGTIYQEFSSQLCEYLETSHIELYTNGHMALDIAIKALKLKGEVITTPFTFVSTTHALTMNGITPVFCDIKENDFTIDESKIESLINEYTTAILPVHVYGFPCNHEAIQAIASKYNLKLLYDGAHAFGMKTKGIPISRWGDITMYSFHATKVFHTIEGGALSFNDTSLQEPLRLMKNFGIVSEDNVNQIGFNAKMNEFCAAMGLCNLRYIENDILSRKNATMCYLECLNDISGIYFMPFENLEKQGFEYNYSYFPIIVDEKITKRSRDELHEELKKYNIHTRKYFYPLITDMICYKNKFNDYCLPVAQYIASRVLTLPLYAGVELDLIKDICKRIGDILNA